jgi:hypothetical protein
MEIFRVLRVGLNLFFILLPLIILNVCLFFAVGLGNLGMVMLVLGQSIIVPAAVYVIHVLTGLARGTGLESHVFKPATDIGQLVTSAVYRDDKFNVTPSFWITHITFFFAYVFANAIDVFNMMPTSDTPAEEWRVENRKARASMIMAISIFLLIFLVAMRMFVTDLETLAGTTVGLATGFGLGYAWYQLARVAGVRKMDVFGIVQQMVPVTDDKNITYCIPPAKN